MTLGDFEYMFGFVPVGATLTTDEVKRMLDTLTDLLAEVAGLQTKIRDSMRNDDTGTPLDIQKHAERTDLLLRLLTQRRRLERSIGFLEDPDGLAPPGVARILGEAAQGFRALAAA